MRKTIHRNSKKVEQIFENAYDIEAYTLENCFTGRKCKKIDYKNKNLLLKQWRRFDFSKLHSDGNGNYNLHIRSNCWYEFKSIV